jgi:hypothetical protein
VESLLDRSWLDWNHFASLGVTVRLLFATAVLFVSSTAVAERSDPAFLGVGMSTGPNEPCRIDSVTKDSGAHSAGLRSGDIVKAIEGKQVVDCNALVALIQEREPGDQVKVQLLRDGGDVTLTARLFSRAEVLRQRLVGHVLPPTNIFKVEDQAEADLAVRGKTTIVGWFDPSCVGCTGVFAKIAQWSASKSTRTSPIVTLAATTMQHKSLGEAVILLKPEQRKLDVPMLVTDHETYSKFTINDQKRMSFMVIDCKGVVQHIAPAKPDGEDLDAVLEELFTATEQASKLRGR